MKTSGFEMTKRMFLLFFTVTRMMPGTGFMPSFCMAFRDFFSLRDCFAFEGSSPPSAFSSSGMSSSESSSSSSSSSSISGSSSSFFGGMVFCRGRRVSGLGGRTCLWRVQRR